MPGLRRLLWVDCAAGALVGATVLALSGWLARVEGLPRGVLVFTGVVNLLYASYSFSLARRAERPLAWIVALVVANLAWVPVCLALAATYRAQMTTFGWLHLVGEAAFVGALAVLEWRHRHRLTTAA